MSQKFDIPQELYERAEAAAKLRKVTVRRFLLDAILEAVEDVEDSLAADRALARIAAGEDETYTIDDLEALIALEGHNAGTGEEAISEASRGVATPHHRNASRNRRAG